MNKRNSDWYIPPDWFIILSLSLVMPGVAILASIFVPLVGILKTSDMRAIYGFGLATGVIGAFLLFMARLPLYRQRQFWTFGPKRLDQMPRRLYWLAYVLVALSMLVLGCVWLRTHQN